MKNDDVQKAVKSNYVFSDDNAKPYYKANKEKIQKRPREYYGNL